MASEQVWDSNHLQVVGDFDLAARVYAVAMSPIATSHCLVAAAGTDPQVAAAKRQGCPAPHLLFCSPGTFWMLFNECLTATRV